MRARAFTAALATSTVAYPTVKSGQSLCSTFDAVSTNELMSVFDRF